MSENNENSKSEIQRLLNEEKKRQRQIQNEINERELRRIQENAQKEKERIAQQEKGRTVDERPKE